MKPTIFLILLLTATIWTPAVVAEAPAPAADMADAVAPSPELTAVAGDPNNAFHELELLAEVMLLVKRHYVETRTFRDLIYGALDGMLQSLDPHSAFMDVDEYREMQDGTTGRYSGIGIQIGMRDGMLTVIAPFEDTPGFKAGLLAGDLILGIDGQRTSGVTLNDAVKLMRGASGTVVRLTILHSGESEPEEIEVMRGDIKMPTVKGGTMLPHAIGYVRVVQFSEPTAVALRTEIARLVEAGATGLVLDLRGNPGGLLASAVDVAALFLSREKLIVSTRGRDGRVISELRAGAKRPFVKLPVAVLINRGSASASEIVAGALQDHGRAVVVGETSFGKGSVQSIMEARSDTHTAIRLTTAHYYTPSARIIHEHGVEPDIPVYMTPREWHEVLIERARLEDTAGILPQPEGDDPPIDTQLERAAGVLVAVNLFNKKRR